MSFLTILPEDVYPSADLTSVLWADAFGIEMAQALMWMSQAAYETTADPPSTTGPRKLERLLGRWGFDCRVRLSDGGTEGYVAECETAIVVAFAGTDPVVAANWITDFNIRTGTGGVHRGFFEGVESIWPALNAALEGVAKRIVLTGHSLGGALAAVVALRLAGGGPASGSVGSVVTFGAPRAGNEVFAAAYRASGLWPRTVRLVYGNDIVPTVPPAVTGPLGFRHVGLVLSCPHGGLFKESGAPQDAADDAVGPSALEQIFDLTNSETLRNSREVWSRIVDHGVPRSPAGGIATLLIDRLPFFLRDHLQDCYLEALGWSFASVAASGVSIAAADADTFARTSEARIEASEGGLSGLLRRLMVGGS